MPEAPAPALTARQPRAIHSALSVLEAVAHLGAGATAREVSTQLGLPRATTYRLLNLLVQDEYLVRTPDLAGFALGAKVSQLIAAATPPLRLATAARAVVADTRSAVRGGVHVVLYIDGRITVVDADPDFPLSDDVRLVREPGRFALGRLLLGEMAPANALPGAVASDLARFDATRQVGEITVGYGCLAVPIRDSNGALAGAVGFSGPAHRISEPAAVLEILRPAAERLAPLVT
ncbi:DNA-binding IclR family transcriptional regulator [Microbacterium endophyticum]|uniref:DNA-binding IclR family transcriptional regulator n=1 Tax=Microbacterium endophyticum TaxID=1526412 RepID=A0A7W4YMY5_9MICO|nr:helix-turn-helix domain-containing protein [Microbacterium endophyticum]MBB2975161.1 DNA-binding IclR family transcriptional regulator [Microbacterium endophyticum]NIK37299.1 DNA-binding IclR family transcriptional regulator [Microbacterium endophyticum]